jgi:hypothetical protein
MVLAKVVGWLHKVNWWIAQIIGQVGASRLRLELSGKEEGPAPNGKFLFDRLPSNRQVVPVCDGLRNNGRVRRNTKRESGTAMVASSIVTCGCESFLMHSVHLSLLTSRHVTLTCC